MSRVPISVLIPCYNSAEVIGACLESVSWADEIFVVDSFSMDETLEICRRYTDRIVQHEYVDSASQKNWAIPQVRHDWVLIVDTDERVSPELRREIEAMLEPDCPYDGFRIPRLNHAFGRPLRHGGYYPDYQVRLFRRDRGRYRPRRVHAHVELQGRCGVLSNPLLHFGQRDVDQIVRTYLLRYSAWEAEQKDADGVRFHPTALLIRPVGAFVVRYLQQRGFLDGTAGLFMACLVSAYVLLTYARLWQLQSRRRADGATIPSPCDEAGWGEKAPTALAREVRREVGRSVRRCAGLHTRDSQPVDELLRVAFPVPHTKVGGAEVSLRALLIYLDRSLVSPLLIVPEQGPITELLAETGTPIAYVPTPHFISTSVRLGPRFGERTVFNPAAVLADCFLLAGAALAYARAFRRARVQVVYTASMFAHLLGVLAAPLARARLVWYLQDIVSPRLGGGLVLPFFAWLAARRTDRVICDSDAVAASLRARWPAGVTQDRLQVIHHGIELSAYDPAQPTGVRGDLGVPDTAFLAVHVGRLVPWKGQREFLEAARLVARQRPDAYFAVVGDVAFEGPRYRDELHRLAQRLGLEDRVIFTGWRRDVPAVLAAADVLVHAAILPEPFGIVIAEAMAMQTPVIASTLGGAAEVVRDGCEGLLVDPRKPAGIAAALVRLADDPELRARMGRAGRMRALSCFGADRFARETAEVLLAVAQHDLAWRATK